ncbi:hypothetical protein GGX14DRAFT_546380 [Mycena pura]|uniref:Uncharacterized protein n=1 Tax=Mycena pura TaxID=153505 RepID=A0AAD6UVD9_9AGAR|nr:hypothetical protein GGX14DRAFT_546380 [Mycena pura]
MERRFDDSDLIGLKRKDLVALVEKQRSNWPTSSRGRFNPQKTNMADMKWALSNCGFTTSQPLRGPAPPNPNPGPIPSPAGQVTAAGDLDDVRLQQLGGSMGPSAAQENLNNNVRLRSLALLIEETRNLFKLQVSQELEVSVISLENCKPGEWRASPARLGIPDIENPGFTKFFAMIPRYRNVECEIFDPQLSVPCNGKLNLTVVDIGGVQLKAHTQQSRSESPHGTTPYAEFQEWAKRQPTPGTSSATTNVKKKAIPLSEDEKQWISNEAMDSTHSETNIVTDSAILIAQITGEFLLLGAGAQRRGHVEGNELADGAAKEAAEGTSDEVFRGKVDVFKSTLPPSVAARRAGDEKKDGGGMCKMHVPFQAWLCLQQHL